MEYLCLRDCFVHNRYHYAGKVYNLPPDEDSKNFKPIIPVEEALKPPETSEPSPEPSEPPKAEAKPKKKKNKKKA